MPSVYAHYRFGVALLPTMPADARRTIQRFRSLFEVGLHGPDIFYYGSPIEKTKTGFLGIKFHEQTGREFFQRVCGWIAPRQRLLISTACCATIHWTPSATTLSDSKQWMPAMGKSKRNLTGFCWK